jgi:hypothetical protein
MRSSFIVKERLEYQGGCHLVDHAAVLLSGMAGFIQNLVGFARGQTLIPKVNWQTCHFAKLCGKCLRSSGLRAHFTGNVQGVADYDSGHAEPSRQSRERAEVVPRNTAATALSLECQHRLRRQAEFVGNGHADAASAHVETHKAGLMVDCQLSAPFHEYGFKLKPPKCH